VQSFKEFVNKPVFGVNEYIDIDGIGRLKAKIDSGNEAYNVLHGVDVSEEDESISFTTVNGKRIKAPRSGEIKIHIGSGVKEDRPIVKLNIKIGDKKYQDFIYWVLMPMNITTTSGRRPFSMAIY
jgi:hypothetical protein